MVAVIGDTPEVSLPGEPGARRRANWGQSAFRGWQLRGASRSREASSQRKKNVQSSPARGCFSSSSHLRWGILQLKTARRGGRCSRVSLTMTTDCGGRGSARMPPTTTVRLASAPDSVLFVHAQFPLLSDLGTHLRRRAWAPSSELAVRFRLLDRHMTRGHSPGSDQRTGPSATRGRGHGGPGA